MKEHDWDYFIGSDIVQAKRECIVPEINRSYHWATMGFHVKASYFSEHSYLKRNLNRIENVQLRNITE